MKTRKGIDVSYAQGKVDWAKVKSDEIQFAIIRCGFGNDSSGQDDRQFAANVSGCEANGIPWGAYLYSYATNLDEAESEVRHVLRLLKGKVPLYPVYLDMEDADGYKSKRDVTDEMCAEICVHVCHRLTEAGYLAGIYANKDWLENRINDSRVKQYPIWLAQWNDEPTYDGAFGIWQYTNSGSVDGISGRVDMNLAYEDYPSTIKSRELNGYKKSASNPVSTVPEKPGKIKIGDTVAFKGGPVYSSSTAKTAAATKGKATCQVTGIVPGAPHPYHCIGGSVYGWVNAVDIGAGAPTETAPSKSVKAGSLITYRGRLYGDSFGNNPGKTVSGTFRVDRVIEGRAYGVHIAGGWVKASEIK